MSDGFPNKILIRRSSISTIYKINNDSNYLVLKRVTKNKYNKRELEILIKLASASVDGCIHLLNKVEDQKIIDFIFPYYPCDLSDFLKRRLLPPKIYRKWLKKICLTMKNLHDLNIWHRDIKPENILLTEFSYNAEPIIADFGYSINASEEKPETLIGSQDYVSPEIKNRLAYTEKIDIYSYGVMAYKMIFAKFPLFDEEKKLKVSRICDNHIKHFLEICLDIDPERRPSFSELINHPFFSTEKNIDLPEILKKRENINRQLYQIDNFLKNTSSDIEGVPVGDIFKYFIYEKVSESFRKIIKKHSSVIVEGLQNDLEKKNLNLKKLQSILLEKHSFLSGLSYEQIISILEIVEKEINYVQDKKYLNSARDMLNSIKIFYYFKIDGISN